jgi:hypothetical protein
MTSLQLLVLNSPDNTAFAHHGDIKLSELNCNKRINEVTRLNTIS